MSAPIRNYGVPPETVLLGFVLDLVVEDSAGEVRLAIDEWHGWAMVTTPGGMDATAGRARLYLLDRGETRDEGDLDAGKPRLLASDTYARWHRRGAERLLELTVPDTIGYPQGRVRRIGYRSDKWSKRGEFEDYEHDFPEGEEPLLYTDTEFLDDAHAALLVGGQMRITEGGID